MNLTEDMLLDNWKDLMKIIDDNFKDDRKEKLKAMYESFQERMMFSPASGNINYHNAFIGGYVEHVLRVARCAEQTYMLWKSMGSSMEGYTKEELMFAALNHDLGKYGDLKNDLYVPNPSEWHRKNQGSLWNLNPELNWMPVQHRSLWLLQHHGIKVSENEMIAIMVHDGLYDESNTQYYKHYNADRNFKTNMPLVLHQADLMASKIEGEINKVSGEVKKASTSTYKKKTLDTATASKSVNDIFSGLFQESK
jgi:5'-deoxynucleotidase YfbR-like HD superfamily hydrolase